MSPWDLIVLGFDYQGWMGDPFGFRRYPPAFLWDAIPKDDRNAYDKRAEIYYTRLYGRD